MKQTYHLTITLQETVAFAIWACLFAAHDDKGCDGQVIFRERHTQICEVVLECFASEVARADHGADERASEAIRHEPRLTRAAQALCGLAQKILAVLVCILLLFAIEVWHRDASVAALDVL